MAPEGSPYPPVPGEKGSAETIGDNQLHKIESPDYDVKDESESPTIIQYMKRYSQVVKTSNSTPIATIKKLEHPDIDTGDIGNTTTGADYRLPPYNTSSRPFSYPVGSALGYPHPINNLSQAQSRRPYSYVGTANEPYRLQYVPPTATTAGSIQLPPQTRPSNPYAAAFAPWPSVPLALSQDPADPSVKDEMEDQDSGKDDSDHNEGFGSNTDDDESVDDTEEQLMLPGIRRKTDEWPETILDFDGYPDHEQDPPAGLSCYEVCQRYPASIMNNNLLPFIQRRWSADEIFHCLPLDVQQYVHDRAVKQVTNYLFKRIQKAENKLKGLGPAGKTGTLDFTGYLALLNGPRMRDDGRPADIRKNQSAAPPRRTWRKRKGLGIDPDTGLYVEVASQPQARFRALMEAPPADALTSQVATSNQAAQLRPQPNTLRLRKDRRKATPRGGSLHTAARAAVKTTGRGARSRSTATDMPLKVPSNTDSAPLHDHRNQGPASGTVDSGAHDPPRPACTPSQRQPFVGNLSESRSPTLASMFPDGLVNMRGAYVRTMSPNGTNMWHGAPSAEFIENYTGDGRFRLWMDVKLPQQYDPNAPYSSLLAANEPSTLRTGVADWLDLYDFDLPHEKEAKLAAEREARLKRKAEALPEQLDEEVRQPMKKARTGLDMVVALTWAVPDEAIQAIMDIMGSESPSKSGGGGDGNPQAAQEVEVADNDAKEADEEVAPSPGEALTNDNREEVAAQQTASEGEAEYSWNGPSESITGEGSIPQAADKVGSDGEAVSASN